MKGTIKSYSELANYCGEEREFNLTINIKGEEALEFLRQIQKEQEVNIIPKPKYISLAQHLAEKENDYVKKPIRAKDCWFEWFNDITKCCCNEPKIEVIFNEPATILYKDGKRYVCKCDKEDKFSEELGLALCLLKSFGVSYSDFEEMLKGAKRQGKKDE